MTFDDLFPHDIEIIGLEAEHGTVVQVSLQLDTAWEIQGIGACAAKLDGTNTVNRKYIALARALEQLAKNLRIEGYSD